MNVMKHPISSRGSLTSPPIRLGNGPNGASFEDGLRPRAILTISLGTMDDNGMYPLVMTNIVMENHHF